MIPPRPTGVRFLLIVAALSGALGISTIFAQPPAETTQSVDETTIHLRIWQRVSDAEELWISARPVGGRWDEFGTVRLGEAHRGFAAGYGRLSGAEPSSYISYKIQLAGIGLRIWQRYSDLESIFIEACASPCQPPRRTKHRQGWKPLGKSPLPLNDGHSPRGHYRYGNLTLTIPKGNPGLQSDRQHLLALRDVLEGGATELDWDVGEATRDWEGVTIGGSPPRVVGLDLSSRGLAGELWGYIGDLTQLQELRLDDNLLHGRLPSKLSALPQLAVLTLAGNEFSGCVPWGLRPAARHDFATLGMPSCSAPVSSGAGDGTYLIPDGEDWRFDGDGFWYWLVYDEPPGSAIRYTGGPGMLNEYVEITSIFEAIQNGYRILDVQNRKVWIYLSPDEPKYELMRSHYAGCVYTCDDDLSASAFLERLAASFWRIPPDWIETVGPSSWDESASAEGE
ncbi:MAG: hypothetical protein F4007_07835 [Chloroflexi bacterium]|nr:hypothetical protein [Chloroflexota bacterium]